MKVPGPDHPITVAPTGKRVRVTLGGKVLADSPNALTLQEASYKPVQYIPRADVAMELFTPTDTSTHCPYKGDASYLTASVDGKAARDCAWSYAAPFPAVAAIAGHLAFYPDRVDSILVD